MRTQIKLFAKTIHAKKVTYSKSVAIIDFFTSVTVCKSFRFFVNFFKFVQHILRVVNFSFARCDYCDMWYHPECLGVDETQVKCLKYLKLFFDSAFCDQSLCGIPPYPPPPQKKKRIGTRQAISKHLPIQWSQKAGR